MTNRSVQVTIGAVLQSNFRTSFREDANDISRAAAEHIHGQGRDAGREMRSPTFDWSA